MNASALRWGQAQPWVNPVLRLVLAGVLGLAGVIKLPDPGESLRAVRAFRLLPEALVPAVGYGLPLLEIALAVLLVLGLATRLAAVLAAVLMLAFIIGIASAAARGLSIDCGCFGGGGQVAPGATRYGQEILRDLGLLAAALVVARWPRSRLSVDALLSTDNQVSTDNQARPHEREERVHSPE